MPRTTLADSLCPACQHAGLEYSTEMIDLPFLGESMETMIRCESCGYRHTDFILTGSNAPRRVSIVVSEESDMNARVVRSSSGTIRIPELGINIEPGISSEAFISNVEGILVRVERVLDQLLRDSDDAEQETLIRDMQAKFQAMRNGKADPVTVILDDPFGNSDILHDKVVREPIAPEVAAKLKLGMMVFDNDGNPLELD